MEDSKLQISHFKSEVIKYIIAAIFGIIGFLSSRMIAEIQSSQILSVLPNVSIKLLSLMIAILALLLFVVSTFAFIFYRKTYVKLPAGGYIFAIDPGFYIHKKLVAAIAIPVSQEGLHRGYPFTMKMA